MKSSSPSADTDSFDMTPPFHDTGGVPEAAGVQRLRDMLEGSRADDLLSGRMLQQYQLLERLGAGAMGSVYKSRNTETGELVAVKVLDASFARQHDAILRFEKEARLLAEANSPFITRLRDVRIDGDWPFLVAELVTGQSVAALLKKRKRLTEKTALNIAADVAQALVDISELKIIHRDIKPDNILLGGNENSADSASDDQFVVKLTDFGLARHTQQTQSMALTRANTMLGTPLYMSPEQFSNRDQLDVRSDVYSLGATLFAMLTGRPPFPSDDMLKLAELHRHEVPPDTRSLHSDISEGISQVVARCLQKRPDLRYPSAAELLADLQRLQRGEATSIVVHPALPSGDSDQRQTFRFEWKLASSPAELWPFVSNTERLNRAIGLPAVRYTTTIGPNGESQRFANVRIAGMAMRWREHAFEWIEQRRMGVLREFERGPLKWFSSVVEFFPTVDGRTRLVHSLEVEGRGWFGRQFARYKMGVETRRSLTRVYQRIDATLSDTRGADATRDAFEAESAISRQQQSRLKELTAQLQSQNVDRETLRLITEFVRIAPAQEVGHIRPLELARRLNQPFDQTMAVLLRGAKSGLLELTWDVICPACRVAAQTYDIMRMVRDHDFCEACNTDFDVDLLNGVELIFRAHPQVRSSDTGKYCIGSPAHSPHVVAQIKLEPGETLDVGLSLAAGIYCIRGPQLAQSLTFTVRNSGVAIESRILSGTQHRREDDTVACVIKQRNPGDDAPDTTVLTDARHLSLRLKQDADWQQQVVLPAGGQRLTLNNDFDRDVVVRVERSDPPGNTFSANAAFGLPLFRELFPGQSLDQTQLASVTTVSLLQTSARPSGELLSTNDDAIAERMFEAHLRQLSEYCTRHNGTWIKISGHGALMAFINTDDALRCAQTLHDMVTEFNATPAWDVYCAVNAGVMNVSLIHGHLDYLGPAVDLLSQLLQAARPGETAVGSDIDLRFWNSEAVDGRSEFRPICDGRGVAVKC
ncbi:protein kinase domain-containing protein [Fuerstiella marisgermanici]|uniref:Serine/threonine-protein kinase PknB n=1 Tax=Fuerstiella marisgermanici TaxID=1891926 RepID=A0A1P8WMG8_9PLAN|nr:protein kinase [Fuerstiella marisgermanici]APZ95266.1 Serine/threonine-protein kinase PknB [Fuerstiella marisgermanici]